MENNMKRSLESFITELETLKEDLIGRNPVIDKNNYFKDRKKIGVVIKNVNHLKKAINFLDNNKVNFKKKIAKTRANRIEHFKNSKQIMFVEINKIINNL